MNSVTISGNLGRDSELKQSKSGSGILTFSLAVNDRRKNNATGEWEDYTNWVDVVLFGKRAEVLCDRLKKGTKVAVQGKLSYSSWEKDGKKRSKLEVFAEDIDIMTTRDPSQQQAQQPYQQVQQPYQQQPYGQQYQQPAYGSYPQAYNGGAWQ